MNLKSPSEEAHEVRMRLWDIAQLTKVLPEEPLKQDFKRYMKNAFRLTETVLKHSRISPSCTASQDVFLRDDLPSNHARFPRMFSHDKMLIYATLLVI